MGQTFRSLARFIYKKKSGLSRIFSDFFCGAIVLSTFLLMRQPPLAGRRSPSGERYLTAALRYSRLTCESCAMKRISLFCARIPQLKSRVLRDEEKTPMQSSPSGDCIGVTSYITIINCPKSVPIILPEYPPPVTDFQLCTHFHWSLRRLCIMPSVVISGKNNPLLHHPQQRYSSLYTAALRFL